MSDKNRRRFTRVRTSGVAALLQIDGSTTSVVIDNISLGGVFLRSARPMNVGTRIQLRVVRPGLKIALGLHGVVVGVLSPHEASKTGVAPGMRIQFERVTEHLTDRLSALLVELGLPPGQQHIVPERATEPPRALPHTSAPQADPFAAKATVPGIRRPGVLETVPAPREASPPAKVEDNPFLHRGTAGASTAAPEGNPFLKPADPAGFEEPITQVELTISGEDEDEREQLMTHVRGLMMQLGEAEAKIGKLVEENRKLKARLWDLENDGD